MITALPPPASRPAAADLSVIAAESRSQHKSQAFGTLQRKGALLDYVRREATRVPAPADPKHEGR